MNSVPRTSRALDNRRHEPDDERSGERERAEPASHDERVRASLDWALDEYATTLEKLSR